MKSSFVHGVFRSYIALARGETFTPSEIGDSLDFVGAYSGRLIGSFPLCQTNYFTSEDVETAIEKFWRKDAAEQFKAGVVTNPGRLANRMICNRLTNRFGQLHEKVLQFDRFDHLNIPKGVDFFVPKREGNFITQFLFYRIEKSGIRALNK
jgi:hypothetical protein